MGGRGACHNKVLRDMLCEEAPLAGRSRCIVADCSPRYYQHHVFYVDDFCENIFLCFGMGTIRIKNRYYICVANLTVDHAQQFHKGGLMVENHNNVTDESGALLSAALTP